MLIMDAAGVAARARIPHLVNALEVAFRGKIYAPERAVLPVPRGDGRLLLLMPAHGEAGDGIVKLVTVFPDNAGRGQPMIQGSILVFNADGAPVALLDGATVTRLRTGAASALASKYLSRPDSQRLLIIGTGALAPAMAEAHAAVRPISHVSVWGRSEEKAQAIAHQLRERLPSLAVEAVRDLASAVQATDIVSCCTNSAEPILQGRWLKPGTFVDLVGSFSPKRRESDDEVMLRSRIFVDTFEGAWSEAGDILEPISRGVITPAKVEGDLADLVCGRASGRSSPEEVTLFKSVGTALEDYAAARAILS